MLRTGVMSGLLALALAGPAQAQQTYESMGEGVTVGHFILHPTMAYEYTYDDNVLFTGTEAPGSEPIASGIIVARLRFLADLPVRDSRIRFVYAPFYRRYTSDRFKPEDWLNHVFNMEATFHQSGPITVSFRDAYVHGTVSLEQQVERNGLSFGLGHYSSHSPSLEFGLSLGTRHGFSLLPSYTRSNFTGLAFTGLTGPGIIPGAAQIVEYGYTTRRIEGRYNYKLTEPTTLYGYSAFEGTTQTLTGVQDVDIQSRAIGLGLTRTINENLVTTLSAGYETLDFVGGIGPNFSGPVGEANIAWQVADVTRIDVGLLRKPFASIYADSNYYLATEGRARLTRQLGRSTYMDAGATLMEHQYFPLQGLGRRERLIRLEVGTGHQILKNLRAYFGLNYERRESNVLQLSATGGSDPFHYELHRILFRIEAGWL